MTTNRTYRARLARALAAVAVASYQTALSQVIRAAEAGLLPQQHDEAGVRRGDLPSPSDAVVVTAAVCPSGRRARRRARGDFDASRAVPDPVRLPDG